MRTLKRNWKRMIGIVLAVCLMPGALPAQAAGGKGFSDVNEQDWFYPFVEELSSQGIVSGYPDGRFQPQKNVTVGEVLSLVLIAAGHGVQTKIGEHWSSGFADYALHNGYLTAGLEENLDAEMKRLDVAQLAAKAMKLVPPKGTASAFTDTKDGYVNILYQKGILAGSLEGGNRVFKPDDPITRAEISAIVWNIRNTDVYAGMIETKYYYVDVLAEVPVNSYDPACFTVNDGRAEYHHPDVETMLGVDVASFQGNIDWKKVKADGIDFVIIRIGGRGYTEGGLYEDKNFDVNIQGALEAGLEVGAYFFSQAVNEAEALEEAEFVLEKLKPYRENITFPVVFDWEDLGNANYRTYRLDSEILGSCANLFCGMMEEEGYQPMIYFNRYGAYRSYDLRHVQKYPFWFAQYLSTTQVPTLYYEFAMWQFSDKGIVDGIPANVDLNLYFKKK